MTCQISRNVPGTTWQWYRPNGDLITANIHSYANGSEVAVMTGQDGSDYGRYKCVASNVAGNVEHRITVIKLCKYL